MEVLGHDNPCTAAQLTGVITGPGSVPGPPNLLGEKGLATTVPLRVTNHSGRTCSVFGTPEVQIASASGTILVRNQLREAFYGGSPEPAPPAAVVELVPRTGSATTKLYWYLGYCGADPNPVAVTITFPANGATITVKPLGGWTPPPCRSSQPPGGAVGADVFVAA